MVGPYLHCWYIGLDRRLSIADAVDASAQTHPTTRSHAMRDLVSGETRTQSGFEREHAVRRGWIVGDESRHMTTFAHWR